jgi:hypothetical protein
LEAGGINAPDVQYQALHSDFVAAWKPERKAPAN